MAALGFATVCLGLATFPQVASAGSTGFWLECPTTEVDEGDDVTVYLRHAPENPDVIYIYTAWFHTDAGTATTRDYVAQNRRQQSTSQSEARARRMAVTVSTTEDDVIEEDETFTIRFSPTDSVRDPDDSDYDEKCELTILNDDYPPTLQSNNPVEVLASGTRIALRFDSTLDTANPPPASAFEVEVDGDRFPVDGVAVDGSVVNLDVLATIRQGQTVEVGYTDPTSGDDAGAIQDTYGTDAADFTRTATNSSATIELYGHLARLSDDRSERR